MNPTLAVPILFLSSIGWGLSWLPLKALEARGLEGPLLVLVAFGCASLVLLWPFLRQRGQWRSQLRQLLLIAVLGGFANLAFQIALQQGEVIRVMILFYLLPVWSVLGGRLVLGERIDALRLFALGAALLGALLILGGVEVLLIGPSWVDLLALGAGMGFAFNNIAFRATPALPVTSKIFAMFAGGLVLIALYLMMLAPVQGPAPDAGTLSLTALYGMAWLLLITFGTQWAVTCMEAGRSSLIIVMELVTAVVSAALLLGETLDAWELLGGLLVLSAAVLEGRREAEVVPVVVNARPYP
jgi:drug/metabolite transporter (DMT)-like permease